jgi:prevent-host-death family protein
MRAAPASSKWLSSLTRKGYAAPRPPQRHEAPFSTTTPASRNFSAVLDEAEHGETIVVTRNGRRVALIIPAPRANGSALLSLFQDWAGRNEFDEDFATRVAEAASIEATELDSDPWQD